MTSNSIHTLGDIYTLIVSKTGCSEKKLSADVDLVNDLGCYGDDFHEFIDEFAGKFQVDMSGYRWYFHTEDEGHTFSIGRIFFKAPSERVDHIPITPSLLLASANSRRWALEYPAHTLPKFRYDILINQVVFVALIVFIIYKCARD